MFTKTVGEVGAPSEAKMTDWLIGLNHFNPKRPNLMIPRLQDSKGIHHSIHFDSTQCFKCRLTFHFRNVGRHFVFKPLPPLHPQHHLKWRYEKCRLTSGKILYVDWHFRKMSADISRKTQYIGWSWKLEKLRNFYNG